MTGGLNEVFRALADPTRREILHLLRDREHTAGELAEHFALSKSTLSGHFAVLKAADLVATEKRGTTVIYRVNTTVVQDLLAHVLAHFGQVQGQVRGRLPGPDPTPSERTDHDPATPAL